MPDDRYKEELKSYITLGKLYIRKKDILKAALAVMALFAAVTAIGIPLYNKYFGIMTVSSPWLKEFSGRSLVYDLDGKLLYDGDISNGIFTGFGKLYRESGQLLYEGEFKNGEFSGEGSIYSPNGRLRYNGSFKASVYDGHGTLYDEYGFITYEGEFLDGLQNGFGQHYDNGAFVYEGNFLAGEYSGQGKLFDGETLVYNGGFSEGLFNGQGFLYSYESLKYDGSFLNGLYDGQGKEYSEASRLIYEGDFTTGQRNGFGELYSDRGNLLYGGLFLEGEIDYVSLLGKSYSEALKIFPGRSYASYGRELSKDSFDSVQEIDEEAESGEFVEYFCEVYEETSAALIFCGKDGKPVYVDAVVVWENVNNTDYQFYNSMDIPFWINVFFDNEKCPVKLDYPSRILTDGAHELYHIYHWIESGNRYAGFYTIEYRTGGGKGEK